VVWERLFPRRAPAPSALDPFRQKDWHEPEIMATNDQSVLTGFRANLKDGTPVLLRPVVPEDRDLFVVGMANLSFDSRYFRFFTPQRRLTREQLSYFTEVDQRNHVAWVGVGLAPSNPCGLGAARFVRRFDDPSAAEFALTVIDAHQKKGLGTHLLAVLYVVAEQLGVRCLEGIVLPENRTVIDWLVRLDARLTFADGVWQARLPVSSPPPAADRCATAFRFRAAVDQARPWLEGGPSAVAAGG
jgi:GNAT superfamily N-acetyltransferase